MLKNQAGHLMVGEGRGLVEVVGGLRGEGAGGGGLGRTQEEGEGEEGLCLAREEGEGLLQTSSEVEGLLRMLVAGEEV